MSTKFERKTWITLYVLELEHGCFYVGQSSIPLVRLSDHDKGKASAWTKAHRPIRLLERRPAESKNWKHAEEIENQLTLMMMRKHGWQRVRGGYWTNVSEELTRKNLLHHKRLAELAVSQPLDPNQRSEPQAPKITPEPSAATASSDKPARANRPWSQSEDDLLRKEYAEGHTVMYIAECHCRTEVAIAARLVRIGVIEHRHEARRA
jgi:predicted GIY-YIG superfamily endonuclease